jgi:hypothetical protein
MRGSKNTTYAEKELMGTLNKTRDKKPKDIDNDSKIYKHLNNIEIMLDKCWKKLNDENLTDIEQIEKYSKLFIMFQKHYFTYRSLIPKKETSENNILAELINEKEN